MKQIKKYRNTDNIIYFYKRNIIYIRESHMLGFKKNYEEILIINCLWFKNDSIQSRENGFSLLFSIPLWFSISLLQTMINLLKKILKSFSLFLI